MHGTACRPVHPGVHDENQQGYEEPPKTQARALSGNVKSRGNGGHGSSPQLGWNSASDVVATSSIADVPRSNV